MGNPEAVQVVRGIELERLLIRHPAPGEHLVVDGSKFERKELGGHERMFRQVVTCAVAGVQAARRNERPGSDSVSRLERGAGRVRSPGGGPRAQSRFAEFFLQFRDDAGDMIAKSPADAAGHAVNFRQAVGELWIHFSRLASQ